MDRTHRDTSVGTRASAGRDVRRHADDGGRPDDPACRVSSRIAAPPRTNGGAPSGQPTDRAEGAEQVTGQVRGDVAARAAAPGAGAPNATGGASGAPASLAAAFHLATPDLREQGALSIRRIADYLGVAQQDVAAATAVKPKAASARPALPARGSALQPFADVIALVRDVYGGDHDRVRAWLRAPRPELSGKTPLAVMLEPGHVVAVRDLVETAWAGDPD